MNPITLIFLLIGIVASYKGWVEPRFDTLDKRIKALEAKK